MTKVQLATEVIIPIIAVIVIFLISTLIFITKTLIKRKRRDLEIKTLFDKVSPEKLNLFNSEVSKMLSLASANAKFDQLALTLRDIFDQIENHYQIANKILGELNHLDQEEKNKDKYHISNKAFRFKVDEIKEEIKFISTLEEKFDLIVGQITHQDEFLRSEFSLYRINARKTVEVYQTKRLLLDKISSKVDQIAEQIKNLENEFNRLVLIGEMKKAAEALRKYSRYVIKFAEIINEGPQIQTYIDEVIKKAVVAVIDNFNKRKAELAGSFRIINFEESIKDLAKQFEKARSEYEKLNIEEAKEQIRKILKAIKALEKIINLEIRSRNAVLASYKDVNSEIKIALQRYLVLKEQFRTLVEKGEKIPLELNDLFVQIKNISKDIDAKAVKYSQMIADKEIAYSSKLQRSKMLIQETIEFTQKMNEFMQMLWAINIEVSLLRNKFKKAEAAINEVMANIKRQNIVISQEAKQHLENIVNKMNDVAIKLNAEHVSKDTANEVNLLVENAVVLYKGLNSNIQIAEMTANVIREFSPQRALNEKINFALLQSEKLYLEGKYPEALNTLVGELESGLK